MEPPTPEAIQHIHDEPSIYISFHKPVESPIEVQQKPTPESREQKWENWKIKFLYKSRLQTHQPLGLIVNQELQITTPSVFNLFEIVQGYIGWRFDGISKSKRHNCVQKMIIDRNYSTA